MLGLKGCHCCLCLIHLVNTESSLRQVVCFHSRMLPVMECSLPFESCPSILGYHKHKGLSLYQNTICHYVTAMYWGHGELANFLQFTRSSALSLLQATELRSLMRMYGPSPSLILSSGAPGALIPFGKRPTLYRMTSHFFSSSWVFRKITRSLYN